MFWDNFQVTTKPEFSLNQPLGYTRIDKLALLKVCKSQFGNLSLWSPSNDWLAQNADKIYTLKY